MEPLHPKIREALKNAHPGLSDDEIDLSEELLVRRMLFDPENEADKIAELDRQRTELIKRSMPHYAEIASQVLTELGSEAQEPKPRFSVEIKRHKPKKG